MLEDGRVTQTGTHAQLMAEDGHYREIADVQLFSDVDADERERLRREHPSHMRRVQDPQTIASAKGDVESAPPREEPMGE